MNGHCYDTVDNKERGDFKIELKECSPANYRKEQGINKSKPKSLFNNLDNTISDEEVDIYKLFSADV